MNYFLDTNICIFALKGQFFSLKQKIQELVPSRIKIPSLVKAELLLGAEKSPHPKRNFEIVEGFLAPFEIIPFCERCTYWYVKIRKTLEQKGQLIGPFDLLIAATVQMHQGILITNNLGEFNRIEGLKIEDWTQ